MMHVSSSSASSRRLGFRIHAFAFVVANVLMTALNLYFGEPYWFFWPLLGWSIGILAHWFFILGPGAPSGQ